MKTILKISVLMAVLALPGLASATYLQDVTGMADCDGFTANFCVKWGSAPYADICYTAVLTDDSGAEIAAFDMCDRIDTPVPSGPYPYKECGLTYTGMWAVSDLCGTYTATVYMEMTATSSQTGHTDVTYGEFTATFDCECFEVCNYTPGFWKNHEEDWPVMELTLGGVTYGQDALLEIMDTPVRGDATIILAYHLIAAKLNVLSGSDPSIGGAIDEADALLMANPIGSKPEGDARDMILDVKNMLAGYNELGCGEDEEPCLDKALPNETSSSWSELKANFR
jgi:hypothetical protein